ncbi:MAG: D-glycero-beta-D-manno-heptose-7-phosphate kinase [Proteobacteria bacterium]|nr:D-glycero-beta-D-manno-heptose-7-phosphate kinase [Pseudomonadota bacterium]
MNANTNPVTLPEEELLKLLSLFKSRTIAVLGDVGVDRYTQGSVERISPEAPVPIVFVQKETLKLGLAANVADNVVALGGRVSVAGVIGKDQESIELERLFKERKIPATGLVVDGSRRTIMKERIVAETQQVLRVDYESTHPLSASIQKKIEKAALKAIAKADALIIEDYAKGLLGEEMIQAVISSARKKKIPVLVDPHLKTPARWYAGSTLLTPNKKEAEALAGVKITDGRSLKEAGRTIIRTTRSESLIITLGKDGMAIFKGANSNPILIPTFAREVFDVSGAGDTVISVLALALASGAKLEEAAFISNLAAGVEVSKRGTATVSPQEVIQAFLSTR